MTDDLTLERVERPPGLGWDSMLFMLLAVVGFGVSGYLTIAHYERFTLACVESALIDCGAVTHSAYAQLPGTSVPVSAAGLVWFATMAGLRVLRLRRSSAEVDTTRLRAATCVVGAAGIGFVLYLVYAELVVIHRICEWCTATHVIALAVFLLSMADLQAGPSRTSAADPPDA